MKFSKSQYKKIEAAEKLIGKRFVFPETNGSTNVGATIAGIIPELIAGKSPRLKIKYLVRIDDADRDVISTKFW